MNRPYISEPIDLGPAGAVVATSEGALFLLPNGDLSLARWNPKAKGSAAVLPPKVSAGSLSSRAPAPAFAGNHAYFVSEGRLVRRSSTGGRVGPIEVLAEDAVPGSRAVALSIADGRKVAAYIAEPSQPTGERRARLWIDGAGTKDLSPEGTGATSVALLETGPAKLITASLEGRTSMSPLHARLLDLSAKGEALLSPDVVVTVAPPAERRTELSLAESPDGPVALVALAKDARRFGLLSIPLGDEPRMTDASHFLPYPNGLDPAPVASVRACDTTFVAYARPESEEPTSPAVIELATLGAGGRLGSPSVIAKGRGIRSISLAHAGKALLLVYVEGGRSFAKVGRC